MAKKAFGGFDGHREGSGYGFGGRLFGRTADRDTDLELEDYTGQHLPIGALECRTARDQR
jgi:hypothetical protein